jgi:hypothetical protein
MESKSYSGEKHQSAHVGLVSFRGPVSFFAFPFVVASFFAASAFFLAAASSSAFFLAAASSSAFFLAAASSVPAASPIIFCSWPRQIESETEQSSATRPAAQSRRLSGLGARLHVADELRSISLTSVRQRVVVLEVVRVRE